MAAPRAHENQNQTNPHTQRVIQVWPPERRQGLYSQHNTKGTLLFLPISQTFKAATSLASPQHAEPSSQLIQATGSSLPQIMKHRILRPATLSLKTPQGGPPSSMSAWLWPVILQSFTAVEVLFVLFPPGRHSFFLDKTGICQSDSRNLAASHQAHQPRKGAVTEPHLSV